MSRTFKKILVPTDFSEGSGTAAEWASQMVEAGGTILVCHVVDDVPLTYGYVGVAVPPADLRVRLAEEAAREMARSMSAPTPQGVTVDKRILHGNPFVSISQLAKDERVELIIMGTHGRTGLKHILIGSVTERVVRKAPCPVLVLRTGGKFEMP
jgi:nucleotide-binding universal stress UspA family protein